MSQYARENPDDPFGNMPWHIRAQYETVAREVTMISPPVAAPRTIETVLAEMEATIASLPCASAEGEECGNDTCPKMRLDSLVGDLRYRLGLEKPY